MGREKTVGQASVMGPEWEPAGIVSRKIAEIIGNTNAAPLPKPRAMSQLASVGESVVASPSLDNRQLQGGSAVAGHGGSASSGRPRPNTNLDNQKHQIDWQVYWACSKHRSSAFPKRMALGTKS